LNPQALVRAVHSPPELDRLLKAPGAPAPDVAVVVDVLRATTTLIHAFAHGAHAARAFATAEEARAAARKLAEGSFLLCGEQGSVRIPGFDCGNSPGEFTPSVVRGRTLLVATTNGAPALVRTRCARRQMLGAFVNRNAVVARVREALKGGGEVWLVAAGKEGGPAAEDTACVQAIESALVRAGFTAAESGPHAGGVSLEPAVLERFLRGTEHGRAMLAIDPAFAQDIADAAQVDRFAVVPEGTGGVLSRGEAPAD
jgi:2-phosphosulfolactate phosphatase